MKRMPIDLSSGAVVHVELPQVPVVEVNMPASSSTVVVPLTGPQGPQGPPGLPGDVVALSYTHVQVEPTTVMLIEHDLPFSPAAIDVTDHAGNQHHPIPTWPGPATVRLDFDTPVRGTVRLS